jgi:hypothetical protein
MFLKEVRYENIGRIKLPQNIYQCRTVGNTVIKLRALKLYGIT